MEKERANLSVLYLGGWKDDDISIFLNKTAILMDAILSAKADVMLHFVGDYITPALAVPLLAVRDRMKDSGHQLYFNRYDLEMSNGTIEFFRSSGIYQELQAKSKETIKRVLRERGGEEFFIWNVPAQKNSIIPNEAESETTNARLSGHALDLVMSLHSTGDILSYLYSVLMELFENARTHGHGSTIYTIAQKAKDGDHIIVVYDNGIGIPAAYNIYHDMILSSKSQEKMDSEIIEWAFRRGTSTKQVKAGIPRGMGLPNLRDLVDALTGEFCIASGTGIYYYKAGKSDFGDLTVGISGTIFMLKVPSK